MCDTAGPGDQRRPELAPTPYRNPGRFALAPPAAVGEPAPVAEPTRPVGATVSALSRCVAIEAATFADAYWGRAPVLSRAKELLDGSIGFADSAGPVGFADSAGPVGFADLLSVDAVDELLSRRGLRTPFLRVAKDGQVVPAERFTGGGGAGAEIGDQVRDDKIFQLYADGATLVFQGLHRIWPPLIDFARQLGTELTQPIQVNAYLTPAGSQGFATHYDTHDVFVLQVEGRKRWQIHPPVLTDPLERQAWGARKDEVAATAVGSPALDIVLAPGDALYLPRGWLHSAQAQGEQSLHLTLGVRALTRYSLVEALLGLAADDHRLRATLPYGIDVGDPRQVEPVLAETVEALRDWLRDADPAAVATALRKRAWPAALPAPIGPIAQAAAIEHLSADSRIRARDGLRFRLEPDVGTAKVALKLVDRTISLPDFCADAVRTVLTVGEPVRVGDLPGLDDEEDRITLVRRLLREALVVPAE